MMRYICRVSRYVCLSQAKSNFFCAKKGLSGGGGDVMFC